MTGWVWSHFQGAWPKLAKPWDAVASYCQVSVEPSSNLSAGVLHLLHCWPLAALRALHWAKRVWSWWCSWFSWLHHFMFFLRYLQFTWISVMPLGSTYQCRTCCGGFQPHCLGVATKILQIFSPSFSRFCGPKFWGRTQIMDWLKVLWIAGDLPMWRECHWSCSTALWKSRSSLSHTKKARELHIYTPHTVHSLDATSLISLIFFHEKKRGLCFAGPDLWMGGWE